MERAMISDLDISYQQLSAGLVLHLRFSPRVGLPSMESRQGFANHAPSG